MLTPQYKIFGTLNRNVVPLLAIMVIIYVSFMHYSQKPQDLISIDIISQRNTFRNPIFEKLGNTKLNNEKLSVEERCTSYFSLWKNNCPVDETPLSKLSKFDRLKIDPNLYKKSKWVKKRTAFYRKQKDEKRTKEEIRQLVEKDYIIATNELSTFEREFVTSLSHHRVWAKCFLEENHFKKIDKSDSLCEDYVKLNFPWISHELPTFKSSNGDESFPIFDSQQHKNGNTKCFLKKYLEISNGRGIVITIFPNIDRKRQIDQIGSLLKVLRVLKNRLPIEIIYLSEHWDNKDTDYLINIATGPFYNFEGLLDDKIPTQDIIFVNLNNAIILEDPSISQIHEGINVQSMLALSAIFNSFSEMIMMTYQTIPLAENLDGLLFNNESYKKHGILLFKNPSYYSTHSKYFNVGYFEVQDLLYTHSMASEADREYFNITLKSKNTFQHTNRVFKDNFNDLMDPNLIVLKKNRTLSGLLIAFNLQIYNFLSTRFQLQERFNIELFWIGQELAGTTEVLNFNRHYGVSAGILTPLSNTPRHLVTNSRELCSSSWGQLSDVDDNTLIYVTSHQLENAMYGSNEFEEGLKTKYEISSIVDNPEDYKAILDNPLFISDVLNPPVISKPQVSESSNEPSKSWISQEKYDVQYYNKYECAYNIVGESPNTRTQIISFGEKIKSRINTITKLWYKTNV